MMGKRLPRILSVLRTGDTFRWRFLCIVGYMGLKLKGEILAGDRFGSHDMGTDSAKAMRVRSMTQEEGKN